MANILVIDDSVEHLALMAQYLPREGYSVECTHDPLLLMDFLNSQPFDLIICDLMMDKMSGYQVLEQHRKSEFRGIRFIMLTALGSAENLERALDSGADDFVAKPFDPTVFSARVRSVLRRPAISSDSTLKYKDLVLDQAAKALYVGGIQIELSRSEYKLLKLLLRRPGRVYSNPELLSYIYSLASDVSPNAIEKLISRVRKMLKASSASIQTRRGFGYVLE